MLKEILINIKYIESLNILFIDLMFPTKVPTKLCSDKTVKDCSKVSKINELFLILKSIRWTWFSRNYEMIFVWQRNST